MVKAFTCSHNLLFFRANGALLKLVLDFDINFVEVAAVTIIIGVELACQLVLVLGLW